VRELYYAQWGCNFRKCKIELGTGEPQCARRGRSFGALLVVLAAQNTQCPVNKTAIDSFSSYPIP